MAREIKTHWDARYFNSEAESLTWYQAKAPDSLDLINRYHGGVKTGLIDVGAGNSRLVDEVLADGWQNITLLDISRVALDQALLRLGPDTSSVATVAADITEWKPSQKFQVWHDRAVFHFLTDARSQDSYLSVLAEATRKGSLIVMATFAPDGPESCSGLPVQRYSPDTLADRLGLGYDLLEGRQVTHVTPKGATQSFTFTAFRRL